MTRPGARREFIVACPSHPDVILQRQLRRSLFGHKIDIIHTECPLCIQNFPAYTVDNAPPYGTPYSPPSSQSSLYPDAPAFAAQPSAPFDIHDPLFSEHSDPASRNVKEYYGRDDLTKDIMDLVHSLLDRDNRGPGFVAEQLEMLCAWSLGDDVKDVRLIMLDAGGIYIVIHVLRYCLERLGPAVSSGATAFLNQTWPAVSNSVRPTDQTAVGGQTTLATETLDDATTIVTNDIDLEESQMQFDSWNYQEASTTGYPFSAEHEPASVAMDDYSVTARSQSMLSYPGSYFAPSPRRNTYAGGTHPPTMQDIDQAFGHFQPHPTLHPETASMAPSSISYYQQSREKLGGTTPSVATSAAYSRQPFMRHANIISPPPPTMNDIDRAFGHFLDSPSFSSSTVVGGTSAAAHTWQAQSQHSPVTLSSVVDDSDALSVAAQSTARQPSVAGSSVSAYISPRAPGQSQAAASLSRAGNEREFAILEARWGVAALANFSRDHESMDVIRSARGIETLLGIMARCETDEMIQDCGCECLSRLAARDISEGPVLRRLVTSFGGISAVIRAMRLFPNTPTLQHKCCLFISRMALGDPAALQSLVTLKAVDGITLGMKLHRQDENLQEVACLALCTFMREGQQMYVQVVAARGIEAILTAMWQFDLNASIALYGCESLGLMCSGGDSGYKQALTDAGCVETILSAMRTHSHNADIQRAGCRTLNNLTEDFWPAIQKAISEDALSTIHQAALHDPQGVKSIRARINRYGTTVFKPA